MLAVMVIAVLATIALTVITGWLAAKAIEDKATRSLCLAFSLVFLCASLTASHRLGTGKPTIENLLDNHAVYEVLSVTPLSDGSYAVWLREQDGTERVYRMKAPPPQPQFKVVGNNGNRQYLPYPPPSSQPTN